ncbi:uncharacterized protein LOC120374478 [Mauremys reevesii]|uniref:uncharacterized protein LOC120374478 n=1 Tax=Mauremys reevesii TaxID=260615 RepID=UPI00193F3682|nr:uncharacterized protein LOC120374478 [Mauremys reevesii]
MTTEEAALKVIGEQLQGRDKDEGQQLRFLRAIYPACLAAQDRGQDTLEPRCCKAAVVERIVELIEELPKDSPPSEILASCLAAVGNLSTMKPALEPELESRLLQAALGSVFTLGTETDATDIQALHKVMPELLDAVLGNLLVFGKFFSAGQRKCFLKTAVPAIYNPLLCISQAGLLLTYAILGEAEQLLGYTLEDTTAKVMGQLRSIRQLHQVPEVLQGLSLT